MLTTDNSFEEIESQLNKGALWAVVYGDFMSYMMVFFLVLFAFSLKGKVANAPNAPDVEESLDSIQRQFGGTISPDRLARLTQKKQEEGVSQELKSMIEQQGLQDVAQVEADRERVKIILKAPVLFDPGSAEIKSRSATMIYGVMRTLDPLKGRQVVIEGHTDNVPIAGGPYASNWDLSVARANAVVRLFVQWGFDPARLTSSGYGEYRPIVANDSPEHKAQNRRIEISVIRS